MSEYTRRLKNERRRQERIKQIKIRFSIISAFSIALLILVLVSALHINAKADNQSNNLQFKYYKSVVVKSNDTLWDYAKEYAPNGEITKYIAEVKRINHIYGDSIKAGGNIILPYYSDEYLP